MFRLITQIVGGKSDPGKSSAQIKRTAALLSDFDRFEERARISFV